MSASLAAPAVAPPAGRVPSEFLGLARAFRRDVVAADAVSNVALAGLLRGFRARLRAKPGLRREGLAELARRWEAEMPGEHLLDRRIDRDAASLVVTELRVCAGWWRDPGWACDGVGEPGVCLVLITFGASTKRAPASATTPVASVLLHALARWFQRSPDHSAAALHRDLAALGAGIDRPGDLIAVPGGAWLGEDRTARDVAGRRVRCRDVRTFVTRELVG